MFNPESEKKVSELVELETAQAVKQWGETYKSVDEASEVLLEEIKESIMEIKGLENAYYMWIKETGGKTKSPVDIINVIKKLAENGIKELAQVCAVCNKIKKSEI